MKALIVSLVILIASSVCIAQEAPVLIGKVLDDGSVKTTVSLAAAYAGCMKVKNTRTDERVQVISMDMHIVTGDIPYLICELSSFSVAFECYQEGRSIYMSPNGTTHLATSNLCYNLAFIWGDSGAIVGCRCEDKMYDGPKGTCDHSIFTPQQQDIIRAMREADAAKTE